MIKSRPCGRLLSTVGVPEVLLPEQAEKRGSPAVPMGVLVSERSPTGLRMVSERSPTGLRMVSKRRRERELTRSCLSIPLEPFARSVLIRRVRYSLPPRVLVPERGEEPGILIVKLIIKSTAAPCVFGLCGLVRQKRVCSTGGNLHCKSLPQEYLYRGTSPIRKRPPPWDPPSTLGVGLR